MNEQAHTPLTDAEREELEALKQLLPQIQQHAAEVDAALEQHDDALEAAGNELSEQLDAIERDTAQSEEEIRQGLEQEASQAARDALQ